jgi:hypothetical protein
MKFNPPGRDDPEEFFSLKKLLTDIICDHECIDPEYCRVCNRIKDWDEGKYIEPQHR